MNIEPLSSRDVEKNFTRNIWLLMGLPVDCLDEQQVLAELQTTVEQKQRCFLSTPNLNFVISAKHDAIFRQSVTDSDLSCIDGFPLVKVAKILNIPVTERVTGASLMEAITSSPCFNGQRIFLFGGEEGISELAQQKINNSENGAIVCGYCNPGFGTIEQMSSPEIINKINQSNANYIIVALGANKGQQWIQYNKEKLTAEVLTHFGAALNFSAGAVSRAPQLIQQLHLEWCWRIIQEPKLYKRYLNDGLAFLSILLKNVVPYALWLRKQKKPLYRNLSNHQSTYEASNGKIILSLSGWFHSDGLCDVREIFCKAALTGKNIEIDMQSVKYVDGAFLGLLMLLHRYTTASRKKLSLKNTPQQIERVMRWNML